MLPEESSCKAEAGWANRTADTDVRVCVCVWNPVELAKYCARLYSLEGQLKVRRSGTQWQDHCGARLWKSSGHITHHGRGACWPPIRRMLEKRNPIEATCQRSRERWKDSATFVLLTAFAAYWCALRNRKSVSFTLFSVFLVSIIHISLHVIGM